MAGVAFGASAMADANVVYAAETSESNSESTSTELDEGQSTTESEFQSETNQNDEGFSGEDSKSVTGEIAQTDAKVKAAMQRASTTSTGVEALSTQTATTGAGAGIIQEIDEISGNHGVVAENVTVSCDMESNIKADNVQTNGQTVVFLILASIKVSLTWCKELRLKLLLRMQR